MAKGIGGGEDIQVKLRIITAIDKSLDDISVKDICERAGVSRQTFYNHFDSKYSIVSWWSEWCEEFYLNKIGFEYSWEEGMLRHNNLLMSRSDFLFHALGSKSHLPHLGRDQIAARRKDVMLESLHRLGVEVDSLLEHCVEVYAFTMAETAYRMFRRGRRPEYGVISETRKALAIIPPPLYAAMQLPQYSDKTQLQNLEMLDSIALRVFDGGGEALSFTSDGRA